MSEKPLVSVIILNYNAKEFLDSCLSSLYLTDYPNFEVILVDNGSQDGSIEYLQSKYRGYRHLRIIRLPRNLGFSAGNNIGARFAQGKYLVFLNPDTMVRKDWLSPIVDFLERNSMVGIVQPKILQSDGRHIDSAGGYLDRAGLVWIRGAGEEDNGQYDRPCRIFYAKGAALAIRAKIWNELGGFDEIFFNYYEDTDLCWRTWNAGYEVAYVPSAVVYHYGGSVLRQLPLHLKFHEARGRLIILIKNYSLRDIVVYVPLTILLHVINVMYHLASGDGSKAIAILKGTLSVITDLKAVWSSRVSAEGKNIRLDRGRGMHMLVGNALKIFS